MKRHVLAAVFIICLAGVVAPIAGGDPSNPKTSGLVSAVCGSENFTVALAGNGEFTPGHDVASTAMFIPTGFDLIETFTPSGGGSPIVEHDTSAKAAPIKDTITCTIPLQTVFSGPPGTVTIQGSVTGFWTPR
jgi:hypothetical protein